jgi:hypothetical protein
MCPKLKNVAFLHFQILMAGSFLLPPLPAVGWQTAGSYLHFQLLAGKQLALTSISSC